MSLRPRPLALLTGAMLLTTMLGASALANDGPGASPLGPDTSPGTMTSPEGITWRLAQARLSGAYAAIPAEVQATLHMADGLASGSGGCNQWSTSYVLDGASLTFAPEIITTLMLCEGPGGTVETFFLADLPAVASWAIDGTTLVLSADDGQPVLAFEPQAAPALDGQWLVTSYNDGQGQLVTIDDGAAILTIADGGLSGTVGCNQLHAGISQDGGVLTIGPVASTKMACEPALMEREAAVIAALEASTAVRSTADGGWELLDAAGTPQVIVAPADHLVDPGASPAP